MVLLSMSGYLYLNRNKWEPIKRLPIVLAQTAVITRDQQISQALPVPPAKFPTIDNKLLKTQTLLRLPILMYHHIGYVSPQADRITDDLTVTPEDLTEQIKWFSEQGYKSISLQNLYDYTQGHFVLPTKPVIFTFDDGYDDALTKAVPILKKYGFSGSFAIITSYPGTTLGTNTYASWDKIKQAAEQGMEIVSHTSSHFDANNPQYNFSYMLDDLTNSIKTITQHLNLTTKVLIYPYGHYNDLYQQAALQAGFVMGLTERGSSWIKTNNLMQLPRVRVHGHETLQTLQKILALE